MHPRHQATKARDRWLLAGVLALSLGLNLFPLWWGLPNFNGWAFDELRPSAVLNGLERRFSDGWGGNYPPLHYYLLSLLYWPIDQAVARGWIELAPVAATSLMIGVGRALSVLLATGTVYLLYRAARLFADRPTATLAALAAALVAPFVYYAKTINLEAPYLFWFALSLVFFLKAFDRHRLRDYLGFAAAATFAVCTKDQAYGLYALPPLALAVALHAHRRQRERRPGGWWRTLLDRRLLASALLAAALFAIVHNLAFNWEGFLRHLRIITQRSPALFDAYPPTVAGHLAMGLQSLRHLAFAASPPLLLAAFAGVVVALGRWRRDGRLLALLLFAVSYYATFISVTRHNYDRFLLPVSLVLACFAARGLIELARWRRLPAAVRAGVVALVLVYAGLRALSVDLKMHYDSRYAAERWLAANVDPAGAVAFGRQNMLPRGYPIAPWRRIARRGFTLPREMGLEHVILSPADLWTPREQAFREALAAGEAGYELRWAYREPPPLDLLDADGIYTNLAKLNPGVEVFRRRREAEEEVR